MAVTPVIVREHPSTDKIYRTPRPSSGFWGKAPALPPVSAFAFADILREADCLEFQVAINGIADIYAKSKLSLANEHEAHMPPLGEITTATPAKVRKLRPAGFRTALSAVPEASSGSSEGSRRSKKATTPLARDSRGRIRRSVAGKAKPPRQIRIGGMGRSVTVLATTATTNESSTGFVGAFGRVPLEQQASIPSHTAATGRTLGYAISSLRTLLTTRWPQTV
jgi:hypothetical protein